MRNLKLALIGQGTVGTGVARLLIEHAARFQTRCGTRFDVKWVVVRDPRKARPFTIPGATYTSDLRSVLEDRELDAAVELIGGIDPAYDVITQLLKSGKDVVTANKAVLAAHGRKLFEIAHQHGRCICFEASVAGGIPILTAVSESLAANAITRIAGILNGTSNYILSAMHDEGRPYEEALRRAQERGFAEADPTLDVNGTDAAQKLAILARLAFQSRVNPDLVTCQGIDTLSPDDIRYAKELGYVIKLLAVAQTENDKLYLRVSPTLVHEEHPMGKVRGEYNAIEIDGDAVGDTFYFGKGAGMMPTASAVVGNLLDLAVGRAKKTFDCLRLWEEDPPGPVFDPDACLNSRFYLRYTITDQPGRLAQIAQILGKHGIGISSVIQHETGEDSIGAPVPLIIMTHRANEGAMRAALQETDSQQIVHHPTVCLHVAD